MDEILKKQFIGTIIGLIIIIILGIAWISIGILCVIKVLVNFTIWTYWDTVLAVWLIISGVCWMTWRGSR